jgi:sugar (pentulose or hexulose) kinase
MTSLDETGTGPPDGPADDAVLVGIDLGSSGARVAAYDHAGDTVASGEAPLEGGTTADWERALVAAAPDLPDGERVVAVTSTSGTVVATDAAGEPVAPPLRYDERADPDTAAAFAATDAADRASDLGVPVGATAPLPTLASARGDRPAYGEARWYLPAATWLTWRLLAPEGEAWAPTTDWTNALKFGADVAGEPSWLEDLFAAADVSTDRLPDIAAPGDHVGTAAGPLASRMALRGASLHLGVTDGNAAALGMGCLEPGDWGITCGSTSVVKGVTETRAGDGPFYYHRHPLDGWLAGAAFDSGATFRWLARLFDRSPSDALDAAAAADPGEEYGFLPQGDRSPFDDGRMANTLAGLWADADPDVARGRLFRGVALGVALAEGWFLDRGGAEAVRLLGGGAPDDVEPDAPDDPGTDDSGAGGYDWWNRLRAAAWDRPVTRMAPRTTAGAVLPAALDAGVYGTVDDARDALCRVVGPVEPSCDPGTYAEARDGFGERWRAARGLYGH